MFGHGWLNILATTTIMLSLAVTVVPILLGFRQSRRKLELDHIERMRAIELGHTATRSGIGHTRALSPTDRLVKGIGVTVPLGSLGWAFLANLAMGYHEQIWVVAGMVALAGVICGAILAGQSFKAKTNASELAEHKPYVEDDAYDVVAARG